MKKFTKYSLSELEEMETISQGHEDNLKVETENIRVWLSRLTIEDGMEYNNQVTVEVSNPKTYNWEIVEQYEAMNDYDDSYL